MDPFTRLLLGWTLWRHHDGDPAPSAPAPVAPPPAPPAAPEPPTAPAPDSSAGPSASAAASAVRNGSGTRCASDAGNFDDWLKDPTNAGSSSSSGDEAAGHRTGKKAAEDRAQGILAAVMQAAGLPPDGKPDPEKVIADLRMQHEQGQAELRQPPRRGQRSRRGHREARGGPATREGACCSRTACSLAGPGSR